MGDCVLNKGNRKVRGICREVVMRCLLYTSAEFEAQDKKRKEAIDARNDADSFVFQTQQALDQDVYKRQIHGTLF